MCARCQPPGAWVSSFHLETVHCNDPSGGLSRVPPQLMFAEVISVHEARLSLQLLGPLQHHSIKVPFYAVKLWLTHSLARSLTHSHTRSSTHVPTPLI